MNRKALAAGAVPAASAVNRKALAAGVVRGSNAPAASALRFAAPAASALRLTLLAAVFCCSALASAAHGQDDEAADAPPAGSEVRDCILMLDGKPLHLRFHISLGGKALSQLRKEYVARLFESLDTDQSGKLSREEAARSPLLRKQRRPEAQAFLESIGAVQTVTIRDIRQTVERVGGETISYRQDTSSADNDDALFAFLDEDDSGMLDRQELTAAMERIIEKDRDRDQAVSFEELLPPPAEPVQQDPVLVATETPPRPTATISTLLRDTRETLLPRRIIRRYDRNRDRRLSVRELGWTNRRFALLDADADGRLDESELKGIADTPVDLELAIDLDPADDSIAPVRVLQSSGQQIDVTKRPDFIKIKFETATITFARRYLDPLATALDNALTEFNIMDADANGYLEKEETELRVRFARGLFELIDADSDGKIFGEEMERYIRLRGEPSTTSCRVNLYDTGHGFFMALDANGDGRIGVRERRAAARSLMQMDRDGSAGITASEPLPHFHMEFVRGSYKMFGPAAEINIDTPAFQQRAAVGPVWFQRMDRNGDGDLSWSEFLGPRDVFHKLDRDFDGLIDPQEAANAEE